MEITYKVKETENKIASSGIMYQNKWVFTIIMRDVQELF